MFCTNKVVEEKSDFSSAIVEDSTAPSQELEILIVKVVHIILFLEASMITLLDVWIW